MEQGQFAHQNWLLTRKHCFWSGPLCRCRCVALVDVIDGYNNMVVRRSGCLVVDL